MVHSVLESYRYKPEYFSGVLGLSGELEQFYKLLEIYKSENTVPNRLYLEIHSVDLFFTIKHRRLEGNLSPQVAEELKNYIEDLLNDD